PPKPIAQAILDEMGRDSGVFDFDRLTNDGTAGRLLSGHLTAALAAGEKVQVSTDGGRTWRDALMKPDGTWMVIDPNAHAGSWTVQTRVVNDGGMLGPVKMYDVELDVASPNAPSSATRSGNVIDVSFAGAGATAGDMINVMIGDHRITYTLTGADVASGRAKVTIPASIAATMDEHAGYGVALVDRSGNVSEYLLTRFEEVVSGSSGKAGIDFKVVDFNNETPRDLVAGGIPANFGIFSLSITENKADQGIRVAGGNTLGPGIKPDAGETGLLIQTRGARFYLNDGAHAQALTIDISLPGSLRPEWHAIEFYDDAGKLVHRYPLYLDGGEAERYSIHSFNIVIPDGAQFSSFGFSYGSGIIWEATNGTSAVWIDNVGFAGGTFNAIAPMTVVDFNNEAPRDLVAGGMPANFGVFSLSISGNGAGQGIRVAGGNTIGPGIKPDAGETGLLIEAFGSKFYLNNGAHAQSLAIDISLPSAMRPEWYAIEFFDDAGNLVHRRPLFLGERGGEAYSIHSFHVALPDGAQFSSFGFSSYASGGIWETTNGSYTVWIDNIGFGGGSFANSTWQSITELVPPAD
ncbi:hypothetical protein ACV22Z_35610, partial [Burkholderia sp. PU8-34]